MNILLIFFFVNSITLYGMDQDLTMLLKNEKIRQKCAQELQVCDSLDVQPSMEYCKKKISEYEEQGNNTFLLTECVSLECPLARTKNSRWRAEYTKEISSCVCKIIEKNNEKRSTTYVSFASGGLWQDYCNIRAILSKKNNSALSIHFIDKDYIVYDTCRYEIYKDNDISEQENTTFAQFELVVEKRAGGRTGKEKNIFLKQASIGFLLPQLRMLQFIKNLKKDFPQATLLFSIHSSAHDFLQYVQKENIAKNIDFITAADIYNESKFVLVNEYINLVLFLQAYNPLLKNRMLDLLDKELHSTKSAHILSIKSHLEAKDFNKYASHICHGKSFFIKNALTLDK